MDFIDCLTPGLKIKKTIASPTFVLMKVYPVRGHRKIKKFIHLDAYRIKSAKDLISIGLEDYLSGDDTVTIIEWADKIKKILPKETRFVKIKYIKYNKRIIYY